MTINISYNAADNIANSIAAFKIKFGLRYHNTLVWATSIGISGIICLVFGTSMSLVYTGLGAAFLFLSIFYNYTILRNRSKIIKGYSDATNIQNNIGHATLLFNDEQFAYSDLKCRFEIKWSYFQGYFIRDNFLFLVSAQGVINAYAISKQLFENNTFSELSDFLAANVPLYKNKRK